MNATLPGTKDWDIVGHEHAIDLLQRALAAHRVRHAYLFTGPEHIGKTLLAQRFAQTLLCTGGPSTGRPQGSPLPVEMYGQPLRSAEHAVLDAPTSDAVWGTVWQSGMRGKTQPPPCPLYPCGVCLSCRKVMHGNHPDVHFITRAPDKQFILIEQVRALQSDSARKTLEGRYNIFIIAGMHEMNAQAANCLLKTLEEPETGVVLLLTAPDPGLLLPTILSRVQQVSMHLLTPTQIKAALQERWDVEPDEASLIAALAAGRMGWAIQAVEDGNLLAERKEQLQLLANLLTAGTVQRFDIAQQLSGESDKLRAILELWLLWWRDIVLAAHNSLDLVVNVDMRDFLAKQAAKIGPSEAERMLRAILRTMEALDQNVNARVALEVLMLDMPEIK